MAGGILVISAVIKQLRGAVSSHTLIKIILIKQYNYRQKKVMLISFLFREEAILKLRTNLRMHLRRFMGLGFTSIKKMKLLL